MSILIVLGALALVAAVAAIRTVVRDGYHRIPVRHAHEEAVWPTR